MQVELEWKRFQEHSIKVFRVSELENRLRGRRGKKPYWEPKNKKETREKGRSDRKKESDWETENRPSTKKSIESKKNWTISLKCKRIQDHPIRVFRVSELELENRLKTIKGAKTLYREQKNKKETTKKGDQIRKKEPETNQPQKPKTHKNRSNRKKKGTISLKCKRIQKHFIQVFRASEWTKALRIASSLR